MISSYKTELNISNAIVDAAKQADPTGLPLSEHLFGGVTTVEGVAPQEENWNYGDTLASGATFPQGPNEGDYFVRTDFQPKRLFVRRGTKWHRLYDNVTAQTWSDRTYNAGTFINNEQTTVIDDREFNERQSLSEALLPKADVGTTPTDQLDDDI